MSTMTTTSAGQDLPVAALPRGAGAVLRAAPAWLRELAAAAGARFDELGLPTTKHEEWRFTSLKPLRQVAFQRPDGAGAAVTAAEIAHLWIEGLDALRLVFVNGRFAPELSDDAAPPRGVVIAPLSEALDRHEQLLRPHLTRHARFEDDAFTALNTASLDDGVFIHVGRGVDAGRPIHVLNVTAGNGEPLVCHPRNLIVTEASSRATFIEDYVGIDEGAVYLTNAVTELVVGADAEVHHYLLERESRAAFNISTLAVRQERDSRLDSHSVLLGGAIVRNNVHPVLAGENCHSLLNGLYIGRDRQVLDNHMRVEHASPHCDSRQYYKGILGEESHGIFTGRIVVARDAQKTDAIQSNGNLLLSSSARANARPQLEIFADDVRCTHGATIGQLDEQAIFYLRSRGISEVSARAILIYAFAEESLQRMTLEPMRAMLEQVLVERLPQAERLAT